MKVLKRKKFDAAMSRLLLAIVASMATISAGAASPEQARLLVGIMVDGLDADQLDLLREHFSQGGFRLLEEKGVSLTADYGTPLDATAATATIFSGAAPSTSGIGSDTQFDRRTLRESKTYSDSEVLGNFSSAGYSPKSLRVSNLSDEARIASGGTNNVYSIAATPGLSIGMAGHNATGALWLDHKSGNWASSTAYPDMPIAVATRNLAVPLSMRLDTMSWTPSLEPADYPALPDHLTRYPFRYVFPRGNADRLDMFAASPMLNREVTSLAGELITKQKLGSQEGVTDVISLAYTLQPFNYGKSTDKRVELQDAYIKLDRNLEQLFCAIDKHVGLDRTVIMLAATPPRSSRRRDEERFNLPYGEFSARKAASLLNLYLIALHGNGAYVSYFNDGNLYLNHKLLEELKLDVAQVRAEAAKLLASMTGVDRVFTLDDIIAGHAGENAEALRRNTVVSQAGDLLVEVAPGFEIIDDYNTVDPTEGHTGMVKCTAAATAPVFIFAPALKARTIGTPVDARAIAPTVARILRIRSPNGAAAPALSLTKK